ncbi:MAG: prolyl oligopeptidase family serine peptidase [Deltaproteobacteria bacterium]|nr:prolyl oligopeptidase family serine peptidase [Deltaproteobacteria bacterium]
MLIVAIAIPAVLVAASTLQAFQEPSELATLLSRLAALEKSPPGHADDSAIATMRWHLSEAETYAKGEPDYSKRSMKKAARYLDRADKGEEPLSAERGIVARAYDSPYSTGPQAYSVYVPKNFDPDGSYGLILNLHGGSSNHNLFLAVTLGHWNLPWKDYWSIRHDEYVPTRPPPDDFLVAAPDGFGQIRYRWMAEVDIMQVVQDIRKHYPIDPSRIALCGISNGGIGAYTIGTKHASSFSGVYPMAGISDWLVFYKPAGLAEWSKKVLRRESAVTYAGNARNTHYHFVHGTNDAGPMKVTQARTMHDILEKLGVDHVYKEFTEYGHDIIFTLWNKERIYKLVRKHPRDPRPASVWIDTMSYRAARQFWVSVDQMEETNEIARVRVDVVGGGAGVEVTTQNVLALSLYLDEAPVADGALEVKIDGTLVKIDDRPLDGRLPLVRREAGWEIWLPGASPPWGQGMHKRAGLSGPMGDANYEPQVHVYGTQVPEDVKTLEHAARLGARNWHKGKKFVEVDFPVVADADVTEEMIRDKVLVLYGSAKSNSLIAKIGSKLPIKVTEEGIELRGTLHAAPDVGVRLLYPNPLNPDRYVEVLAGNSAAAAAAGGSSFTPYLPDYIVFDKKASKKVHGMAVGKKVPFIEAGFFTEEWTLPDIVVEGSSGS